MSQQFLKKTPFHPRIEALNLAHSWERWQGYTSASLFYSEDEEYFSIRTGASLYDVSPMIKYRITGSQAGQAVNRIMTRDIDRLKPGRVAYSPWCDGKGRVIEEGTIFRFAENDFIVNCAEHQLNWFEASAWGFDAKVEEVTEEIAGLALQGPLSRKLLEDVGLGEAAALPFFGLGRFEFEGAKITVSRTGFTGDLGYELWIEPEHALALWDRLMAEELRRYVKPIGGQALNRARIEAGHILVNVEYVAANKAVRESQMRSPYGLALDWAVDLKKEHFNGKRALVAEKERGGPSRRLVGLDVQGRKSADGAYLYDGKREVGQVTSATWSPIQKRNIALATVEARYAQPGTQLDAEIYYMKEITHGKVDAKVTVVEPRFYQPEHRRA
ncbi:aminomethyltransferase family protein [Limibacillus halophilus]